MQWPTTIRAAVFSCVAAPLFVTGSSAEQLAQRDFCGPFDNWLALQEPTRKELDYQTSCTHSEQVVMLSADWPQFVANFKEYIGAEGFPVLLYYSFQSEAENNVHDAIYHADDALMNANLFFDRARDPVRGNLYVSLITWYLGTVKGSNIQPSIRWGETAQEWSPHFLNKLESSSSEHILKCLMSRDPLIGKVETILSSDRFRNCIVKGSAKSG